MVQQWNRKHSNTYKENYPSVHDILILWQYVATIFKLLLCKEDKLLIKTNDVLKKLGFCSDESSRWQKWSLYISTRCLGRKSTKAVKWHLTWHWSLLSNWHWLYLLPVFQCFSKAGSTVSPSTCLFLSMQTAAHNTCASRAVG